MKQRALLHGLSSCLHRGNSYVSIRALPVPSFFTSETLRREVVVRPGGGYSKYVLSHQPINTRLPTSRTTNLEIKRHIPPPSWHEGRPLRYQVTNNRGNIGYTYRVSYNLTQFSISRLFKALLGYSPGLPLKRVEASYVDISGCTWL